MNESLQQFCQRIRDVVNVCADGGVIEGAIAGDWLEARDGWMGFCKDCEYRVKHKMFKVNGFAVPKPETEEPEPNTHYYIPDLIRSDLYREDVWWRTHDDLSALRRGLVHYTKTNAVMHAKALLGLNPYKDGE